MQSLSSRRLVSPVLLTIIVSVIVISTALFVIGVVIEHSAGTALTTTSSQKPSVQAPIPSGDPDGGHEGSPSRNTQEPPVGRSSTGGSDERIFGLDLESPWFVGAFVLAWVLLIGALLRLGRMGWLVLLVVAIVTTVLDVGEVGRKVSEANTTVATFAGVVAVAHLGLAALAVWVLMRGRRGNVLPSAGRGVL